MVSIGTALENCSSQSSIVAMHVINSGGLAFIVGQKYDIICGVCGAVQVGL